LQSKANSSYRALRIALYRLIHFLVDAASFRNPGFGHFRRRAGVQIANACRQPTSWPMRTGLAFSALANFAGFAAARGRLPDRALPNGLKDRR
jgi:hypothetical protein